MTLGPLAALDAIEEATGEAEVNVIGYCIGGTLLATVLGHMAATGDHRFTSATFFTSIMDFEEAGELTLSTAYIPSLLRDTPDAKEGRPQQARALGAPEDPLPAGAERTLPAG